MGKCYVIVSPFYAVKEDGSLISYVKSEKHGNYEPYRKNLEQLIDTLTDKKEIIFFVSENEPKGKIKEAIEKNENASFFEEDFKNGELHRLFDYHFKVRTEGIKQVFIAGEWVWWHGAGGLKIIEKQLRENSFKVKVIKGCVYPSKSNFRFSKFYRGLAEVL